MYLFEQIDCSKSHYGRKISQGTYSSAEFHAAKIWSPYNDSVSVDLKLEKTGSIIFLWENIIIVFQLQRQTSVTFVCCDAIKYNRNRIVLKKTPANNEIACA